MKKNMFSTAICLLMTFCLSNLFLGAQTTTFNSSTSIVYYTVPAGVTKLTILAKGAQGGSSIGGRGASMQGEFLVTPGQVLKILVGNQGGGNGSNFGGGGGTFVTKSDNSPLIIAGGGGGSSCSSSGFPGLTGTAGSNGGTAGSQKDGNDGSGGTNGGGGGGAVSSDGGGAGGAGLIGNGGRGVEGSFFCFGTGGAGGNGTNGQDGSCSGTYTSYPRSFLGGGTTGNFGGYGGGGGVVVYGSCEAAGGGGGYSGGGGAAEGRGGGGGGSYNIGTNQVNISGAQTGNGSVTITPVQAPFASALSFDGADDFVAVNNPFRAFSKELTVEFWMYTPDAKMPFGSIMGQGSNNIDNWSNANVWLMHPNDDANGTMTFYVNDAGTPRAVTCNMIAGSWNHYAAVVNATSTKIYVNGALIQTGPGISNNILNNTNSVIHLGKDVRYNIGIPGDRPRYGNMSLEEVRIWNRALCPEELNARKSCQLSVANSPGLQQYYQFNQGFVETSNTTVTALNDISGNNRNGALTNFALTGTSSNWVASGVNNTGACPIYVLPTAPISGGGVSICAGTTTTLISTIGGGKWVSSNLAAATINETTGVVTAVGPGTTTITYTTECAVGSTFITVKAVPNSAITASGSTNICPGTSVTLNAVAAAGNTYQWFNNGNSINGANGATYNAANSGAYTVQVTNNGCSSTTSSPITINAVDATPPSFTGTATITTTLNPQGSVYATSPNGAVVNFTLPTVADNCNGEVSVTATPASGSVFQMGTTTVNVVATDASGNQTATTFDINVSGVAPSIVVPTNIISCDPVVNFAATETVGIPASTITYSIAPGSTFPIGTTTVTATATNAVGSSTKSFTVTVSKPIADIAANGATTICEGANVPLSAAPYALQFNGSQHVNVANGFAATNDITIEATITPTVLADGSFKVIMNHDNWSTGKIHFQFFPDGRLQFAINGANPADQYCTYNFIPNTTYRIAVVYSRFGNYVKFYVNGVLINTGLYFGSVPVVGNAAYSIGSWNGNERFFSGTIDDFRVWNVQRTDAQVLSDAAALPIPSGTPNLIRYYKFNEGSGTSTADAAGNGTGTLINNPTWVSTASAGQTYLWSNGAITPSIAATVDGSYTVIVTDAAGCTATSAPITVTVNKAPLFTDCPSNQTANNTAGLNSAIVTYNATVTSTPAATLTYTFSGATTGSGTGTGSGESFNIGITTVTITATNSCGSATCTFTVKINDITPPTINTVDNISTIATSAAGALVTYTAPVGTDNVIGASTTQTTGLASGSTFPIGTTTNTFVVTDAAGNTATSSFTVTVVGVPPVIVVPANITVNNDAANCGAAVSFTATETTAIPASTITYSHAPGSVFPVGTTTLTVTATNAVGSSIKTFTVTVRDNENPVVITRAVTVTLVNGQAPVTAAQVNDGSSDNCGIATMVVSPNSFTCANIGNNTVTLTVTDIHGNVQTATAVVTVNGQLPTSSIVSQPTSNVYTGGNVNNLYLGYGAQSTVLKVNSTGGSAYTYQWIGATANMLSSATSGAPVFAPTAAGTYIFTVIVTNNFGCATSAKITICVRDIRVPGSKGAGKVYLCHMPPGNNQNPQTLEISVNAVDAHLRGHSGDRLGSCATAACVESAPTVIATTANSFSKAEEVVADDLKVVVMPNPTSTYFTLKLVSKSELPVNIKVVDAAGRLVEGKAKQAANSTLQLGYNYATGSYFAEFIQGNQRKVVQLIKIK